MSSVRKKDSLCRYYIRYGDCFHGENCQYIHAYPPNQTSPQPPQTVHTQQAEPPQPPPQQIPQAPIIHQPPPPAMTPQHQGYKMNKLLCSFKSDLPNEIDFAMQVATILANSDNFTWSKDYALVDSICSSLHVFSCVCGENLTCYCYSRFWHQILIKNANNSYLHAATLPPDMEQSYLEFNSLANHDLKDYNKIYKRIKTAAELIRQFSMACGVSEKNLTYSSIQKKKKPKASPSLLKFVSLLINCDSAPLNFIGLDILSNTASKLSKVPDMSNDVTNAKLVQMLHEYCTDSISRQDGDVYVITRSLEVVSGLIASSNKRVSSSIINLITEKNLVSRVEQFLTSYSNVNLFLSGLECCYRISRHQPYLLTSRYLLKVLLNLLNFDEKRFFTSNALKKIKLANDDVPELPIALYPVPAIVNHTTKPQNAVANSQPVEAKRNEFTCEWDNCNSKFTEVSEVSKHLFEVHINPMNNDVLSACVWSSPSGSGPGCHTKRPKFSLLTHLKDFHCNPVALKCAQPVKPPEHPGYASNAAILAIRRHANVRLENEPNSPLNVSIRLTAALILRNLATESLQMKQALENYEPLLSEICMTNGRDESKIIAECLSLFSHE